MNKNTNKTQEKKFQVLGTFIKINDQPEKIVFVNNGKTKWQQFMQLVAIELEKYNEQPKEIYIRPRYYNRGIWGCQTHKYHLFHIRNKKIYKDEIIIHLTKKQYVKDIKIHNIYNLATATYAVARDIIGNRKIDYLKINFDKISKYFNKIKIK